MPNKITKAREKTARQRERGVGAIVMMAIDVDGRRGIMSPDGQTSVWRGTFDEAFRAYIRKETVLAKQNAEEKARQTEEQQQELELNAGE